MKTRLDKPRDLDKRGLSDYAVFGLPVNCGIARDVHRNRVLSMMTDNFRPYYIRSKRRTETKV